MTLWAGAQKQKNLALLAPFQSNIKAMSQSIQTLSLHDLQNILLGISKACLAIESQEHNFSHRSADIDALMNKLISNAQKTPNPLLIENNKIFSLNTVDDNNKTPAKQRKRMAIAVVDDERSTGMATAALIAEFNFDVEYFVCIADLSNKLAKRDFDLVLLDITMPDISTDQVFDFASILSQRGIKVISYSGLFNFDIRLAAVRAGVSDFIVKPTSILGIIEKINRVLHLRKTRDYSIVYIDDQKSMGEFYQTILEDAKCEVHFMDSVEQMFNVLDDIHPDLFLLDMNMPEVNGLEAAKMIRQQKQFDFTPIVFLTADGQLQTKLAALDSGADDVIDKSTPPAIVIELLLTRLRRSMAIREFVSKDSLTGVLNHGQIMEAAMTSFRLAQRQKSDVSIAMLDLDRFKVVNDTFGHAAGDKVLSGLGQLLCRSLRDTDYIGRYGGEEFMLVLVGVTPQEFIQKLIAIKDAFAQLDFEFKEQKFRCTFSVGIANLADNDSLPIAVNQADQALYNSKSEGRNLVTIYDKESD
jgi:diguanylate cyclase (GGDEF)-like protein